MSDNKTNIESASEDILKSLDWIIVVDHSGSTANESIRMPGKTRYDEMKEQCILAANIAQKYDDDGLTLIHFSAAVSVRDGVKADAVANVFREYRPGGGTMLGKALGEAVKKAKASTKETVVLVFTDGEASDPDEVIKVLNQAGKDLGRPKIGFSFIQVGNDSEAKKFLDKLDNDLKVDICATFSEEDAEGLSIEQLVNAARTE